MMNYIPTLCLNMIVKNESKIIERALHHALPLIDCYCICDTGSTDNTKEIITAFFSRHNIPGKIVEEPFKNFSHNRNHALQQCNGMSDYVLLLDADMVLRIGNFDKRELLESQQFNILQGNNHFFFQNCRIVKNNGIFVYKGVTHECLSSVYPVEIVLLPREKLFIEDIGDGGSKKEKYQRDVQLLLHGLNEEPKNDRYHFYLANSYFDTEQWEKAIEWYQKRIELQGWEQEVWYSYFRLGFCYKHLNRIPEAIQSWMEGYNFYPNRLENLFEIMHHYRCSNKHYLVKIFYDICLPHLNNPAYKELREGFLFLQNDIYTYKIFYEFSVSACYVNCFQINNELVAILNHAPHCGLLDNILSNLKFYKDIWPSKQVIDFTCTITENIGGTPVLLRSSSISILPAVSSFQCVSPYCHYIMNIRFVNYINVLTEDGRGQYLECDKHVTTLNQYVELDKNCVPLHKKLFGVKYDPNQRYLGVEDVKLFYEEDKKSIIYMGTTMHTDNKLGMVGGNYDLSENVLSYQEIKQHFNPTNCDKNWCHFTYHGENHIVYRWFPLQIGKWNMENKLLELVETKSSMPGIFRRIRGSSPGFFYEKKNEIWFVCHLVSYEEPDPNLIRYYYNMLVVMDENMNVKRYSAPFLFEGERIEYSLGLVVEDERVLITYSLWDRHSKIGIYDKSFIDSKMIYTN